MAKRAKIYRDLDVSELKIKLGNARKDFAKEIVKHKTGSRNEKAVSLRLLRKDIARIETIITEKEYANLKSKTQKKDIKKPKKEKVKIITKKAKK